jgi:hypothetical protein
MMIEGIPLIDVGAPALVALIVLMILTDRLVWHKRLDVLQRQIETKDKLIEDLSHQNKLMLDSSIPTVNAVLSALHTAAGDRAPS